MTVTLVAFLAARAQHGGTADVDVLDGIREGDLGVGNGLLELVQVDDDQVDQLNAVLSGLLHVLLGIAAGQQRAVNLGVQGLNAAVHHLGIARELLDGGYGRPRPRWARAVPPVEMISTPKSSTNVRAKSTTPVLSVTEINARAIFTSDPMQSSCLVRRRAL